MSSDSTSLLIDPVRLPGLLGEASGRFNVVSLEECASTNTLLMQQAGEGAPSGTVLVADRQTAGRGSRGRHWVASPESSLTFSLLWRFPGGFDRLSGLSLAVGVAVVQALEACGASGVTLKWPNDILHGSAKLGGILVELQADPDPESEAALAVIGIGLNLRMPASIADLGACALLPTSLDRILSALPERHTLFACLLVELAQVLDRFSVGGFEVLREQWHACHAWQNRQVSVLRDGRVEKQGRCAGADVDGALLIETADGLERCLSGDVSLRPL